MTTGTVPPEKGGPEEQPEIVEGRLAEEENQTILDEVREQLQAQREAAVDAEATSDDRLWAMLAYISQLLIPFLIPALVLLVEPNRKRPFQRYHALQALGLAILAVLYEVAATLVFTVLTTISFGLLGCILWPIFLVPIPVFIWYGVLAFEGRRFEVPWLTSFLQDQGWL